MHRSHENISTLWSSTNKNADISHKALPARLWDDSDPRWLREIFLQTTVDLLTDLLQTDVSSIVARKAAPDVEQFQVESEFFCLSEHSSAHRDGLTEGIGLKTSAANMETRIYIIILFIIIVMGVMEGYKVENKILSI